MDGNRLSTLTTRRTERRLIELHPEWTAFEPGRSGTALLCNCPCGCGRSLVVPLMNPLDDGPPDARWPLSARWVRTGSTFDALSIVGVIRITDLREAPERRVHWEGFIADGLARRADASDVGGNPNPGLMTS